MEVRSTQVLLASATETRDKLQSSQRNQEMSLEQLRAQLHEEQLARKLAQQKESTLGDQVADLKARKVVCFVLQAVLRFICKHKK